MMYLRRRYLMDYIRRNLTFRRGASAAREVVGFCDCRRDGLCVYVRAVEVLQFSLVHRRVRVRMRSTEILHHGWWADAAHIGWVILKV